MPYDPKHVAAVRKVLYEPKRLRKLVDHLVSIPNLIGLLQLTHGQGSSWYRSGGNALTGKGVSALPPPWYIPHTGKLSSSIVEAADRCEQVAELLLEIRADLQRVDIPAADKRKLRAHLAEEAAVQSARARLWRAPRPPADPDAATRAIGLHIIRSARALQHVEYYLRPVDPKNPR